MFGGGGGRRLNSELGLVHLWAKIIQRMDIIASKAVLPVETFLVRKIWN